MMRKFLLVIAFNGLLAAVSAQSILTPNLYMYDPSWINPAFVGSTHDHMFGFYGSTWIDDGYDGSPTMAAVSYEAYAPAINSGLGFRIMNEGIGGLSVRQINGLYSYQYKLPKGAVQFGFNVMYQRASLNFSQVVCSNCDPVKLDENVVDESLNADLGIGYAGEGITVGVTLQNALDKKTKSHQSSTNSERAFSGYIAYEAKLNKSISLHPSVLYTKQEEPTTDFSVYFAIDKTTSLGAIYRKVSDHYNEWLLHGGFSVLNVMEVRALYYPEQSQNFNSKRGEILVRVKINERKK